MRVCIHDRAIVALNTENDKYLSYKTSTSGETTGNLCKRCQDSERLNLFGVPKRFNCNDPGYA